MKYLSWMLAAVAVISPASAAEITKVEQPVIDAITSEFPDIAVDAISASPVEGLYEVRTGAQLVYVTGDGRFLLQGDLYDVRSEQNLTESRRSAARLAAVNAVGESSMIVFEPDNVKHTVTVFTDIDCGYCRKLHRQMDGYHSQGIKVRYMFFPRSGPDTSSWYKAQQVWCSADRNAALTRAKSGGTVKSDDCGATPVAMHYELGQQFGMRGTPAIVTDSGELIGGYVPPGELIDLLD